MTTKQNRTIWAIGALAMVAAAVFLWQRWYSGPRDAGASGRVEVSNVGNGSSGTAERSTANDRRVRFLLNAEGTVDDLPFIPEKLRRRLADLVAAGDYRGAIAAALEDADSKLQPMCVDSICLEWARHDKSACLDALRQLKATDVIIDSGLQGLLTGSAVDTSPENIAWVTDMVVKTRMVAGVGERLNLLGSWVVSGVLSVPQFVGLWNEVNEELADGGAADHPARRTSLLDSLAAVGGCALSLNTMLSSPGLPATERFKGVTTAELTVLRQDIAAEFARFAEFVGESKEFDSSGPGAVAGDLGGMAGVLDGVMPSLEAYAPPKHPELRRAFYAGLGNSLAGVPPATVAKLIPDPGGDGAVVWKGYLEAKAGVEGRDELMRELGVPAVPVFLQEAAGGEIAAQMLQEDSLTASKLIASAPEGAIKRGMIQTLVSYLKRIGNAKMAAEWEATLKADKPPA
jgi:hypothetical protein